jgi:arylsulfatase A
MAIRFKLLLFVLFVAVSSGHSIRAAEAAETRPPNIILVLADDLGLSRVGCYGGAPFKTPHLDRLAATGLRFERCYSMPICGPSRSVLLTGKYPFRTGAVNNGNSVIDPHKHPTIANVLRRAGYGTCAIGKLGQSAEPDDPAAPARLGFEESMLWMGRGTPDRYWSPRYFQNGKVVQGDAKDYGPDETHAFLVDFLDRHRTTPCFVYYSAVLTHGPFARTPDSRDDKNLVLDMVAYLDKLMGRLVDDLERLGLRENTIILFTSDNGPAGQPLGTIDGSPMIGSKGDVTEGGVRQPLIVSAPGRVTPGTVSSELVDFSDFFPTILELTGTARPANLTLDGQSFAGQILGKPAPARDWVYSQHGNDYFVANRNYKLYGNGRMFDIRRSPVAEDPVNEMLPEVKSARQTLQQQLDRLRAGYSSPRSTERQASRAPLTPAQLQEDLQVLKRAKLIADTDRWKQLLTRGEPVDGREVAELLAAAAKQLRPQSRPEESVDVLNKEGVLSATPYWKEHAAPGKTCSASNVTRLVHKLALRLMANE